MAHLIMHTRIHVISTNQLTARAHSRKHESANEQTNEQTEGMNKAFEQQAAYTRLRVNGAPHHAYSYTCHAYRSVHNSRQFKDTWDANERTAQENKRIGAAGWPHCLHETASKWRTSSCIHAGFLFLFFPRLHRPDLLVLVLASEYSRIMIPRNPRWGPFWIIVPSLLAISEAEIEQRSDAHVLKNDRSCVWSDSSVPCSIKPLLWFSTKTRGQHISSYLRSLLFWQLALLRIRSQDRIP